MFPAATTSTIPASYAFFTISEKLAVFSKPVKLILIISAPSSMAYCIAFSASKELPIPRLSNTLKGIILLCQLTPAIPSLLLPLAAIILETIVPWLTPVVV